MFIENGYGKTVHIRVEDYLDMSDEDWQEVIASGWGEYVEDPFVDYTGNRKGKVEIIEDLDGEVEEIELDDEENSMDLEEDF